MLRERSYLVVIKSKEVNIAKEVKWVIQDGHGLSLREALPNQNVYFFLKIVQGGGGGDG